MRRAGAFFGFELGVWTAQHLMNMPMKITNRMPIRHTMYQFSVTHWATVCSVCRLKSMFLSRTSGPSASTARHFKNTSQYPWKLSQGEPGRRLIPPSGSPYRCANSLVLRHVLVSFPFWHASSHSLRLSMFGMMLDVRKHSLMFHSRQIEPEQSPLMHSWVPLLHLVLSSRGFGSGHSAVVPLQVELHEHSVSSLHVTLA